MGIYKLCICEAIHISTDGIHGSMTDGVSAMAKRKYKGVGADIAARHMLDNLIAKIESGEMSRNYDAEIRRFARDPEAQARYIDKVSHWIASMRTGAVRAKISEAIQQAKNQYKQVLESIEKKIETVKVRV